MKKFFHLSKPKQHEEYEYQVYDFEYVKATAVFVEECLNAHNHYRAIHGAPPLVVDANLINVAFEWATKIASEDTAFLRPDNPYGENVYMGYNSAPDWELNPMNAVKTWYSKKNLYKYGEPDRSSLEGVGEFTQVVWKTSEKLGVGVAKSESEKVYVVCNYEPAGNVLGQFEANVLPPEKKDQDVESSKVHKF